MATFTFQWQRGNATGTGGWADVPGATSLEYDPTDSDIGHTLRCRVTCSNEAGVTTVYSTPSPPITATGDEGNQPKDDYWDVTYGEGDLREWDSLEAEPPLADTTPVAYGEISVVGPLNIKSGQGISTFTGHGAKPAQTRLKTGRGIMPLTGHAPEPPSVWAGVNIISNNDFHNGLTGWSATPLTAWTNLGAIPFGTEREIDYSSGSASAMGYSGELSRQVQLGTDQTRREHGLCYIGSEWTPSMWSVWHLTFDWRQIHEKYTNNAPWGIVGPPAKGMRVGYGWRTDLPQISAELAASSTLGNWNHVVYEIPVQPGFYGSTSPYGTSPYFQFAFVGYHYVTSTDTDPYGWAFEVKGITLERIS